MRYPDPANLGPDPDPIFKGHFNCIMTKTTQPSLRGLYIKAIVHLYITSHSVDGKFLGECGKDSSLRNLYVLEWDQGFYSLAHTMDIQVPTSATIGAWRCNYPPLLGKYDMLTWQMLKNTYDVLGGNSFFR